MNQKQTKIDVVIPVAKKDVSFVKHVIHYVKENIVGCENVYILTSKKNYGKLKFAKKIRNVELLDEDTLVPELNIETVHKYMKKNGAKRPYRVGWYFQQLLKYAFAKSQWAKEYYLAWDADTLPLNPIDFFDGNQPLFTKKIENHEPYFITMNRLLGFGKLVDYSFIAEHMLFKVSVVKELLHTIENNSGLTGTSWVEKIMMVCDFNDERGYLFSEFETYGNYCIKFHPNLYGIRHLNTFRAAGLIRGRHISAKMLNRMAIDVSIASFEQHDAPFPYNIPWWFMDRVKNKLGKYYFFDK